MRSPFHGWLLNLYLTLALVLLAFPGCSLAPRSATVPNILLILTDDLGYGDVSAYNDQARVTTRNLDALAAEGMRFIDAHSPSTVCTPTRYSILTGQMAFRTGMTGVFTGVEGPCLINQDTLTLPQMLQDSGYTTALFGKWHLGMSFFTPDGQPVDEIDFPVKKLRHVKNVQRSALNGYAEWISASRFLMVRCTADSKSSLELLPARQRTGFIPGLMVTVFPCPHSGSWTGGRYPSIPTQTTTDPA